MKLRSGVAFLLMVVLIVAGIGIGVYQGWDKERDRVMAVKEGLDGMLSTRMEAAYNVLTVAGRHLSKEDELVRNVAHHRSILGSDASLPQKAAANEQLTRDADALLKKLAALPSVQQDSRDKMYVEAYLPQMLTESEQITASANYNVAAREFNESLETNIIGRLAAFLGVKPAEEFVPMP